MRLISGHAFLHALFPTPPHPLASSLMHRTTSSKIAESLGRNGALESALAFESSALCIHKASSRALGVNKLVVNACTCDSLRSFSMPQCDRRTHLPQGFVLRPISRKWERPRGGPSCDVVRSVFVCCATSCIVRIPPSCLLFGTACCYSCDLLS